MNEKAPHTAVDTHEASSSSPLDALLAQPKRYQLALEPQSFDEGWRVAVMCAKLRLCGVVTPEDGYARILTGRALGLPSMASVQGIRLIENRRDGSFTPCMYAKLKVGLLLSRPDLIEYIRPDPTNDAKSATWRAKRVGQPEIPYTFSFEDAVKADLVGRGGDADAQKRNNYDRHTSSMLDWRAAGRLCDRVAGDILSGIASREDVEEEAERDALSPVPAASDPPDAPPAPPVPTAPARDWASEAARIKSALDEAVTSGDTVSQKAAREMFKRFRAEAPAAFVDDVLAHYNTLQASKRKAGATEPSGPPTTSAPPPEHTAAAARAAAAARKASPYLPPNARGDSYDGPDSPVEPEPPF